MFTAATLYGAQPQAPSAGAASAIEPAAIGRDDKGGAAALIDPKNPLVLFGGILAVTLGLIGVSGSVRLGKASFKASVDKD